MTVWKIRTVHDKATLEVAFLFQNEDVKSEIKRILRLLTSQTDPRFPESASGLIVDELNYDAPGWFRIKIPRYGIRLIFRLFHIHQGKLIRIHRTDKVRLDADEGYIDIVQAGYRKDVYGEELRRRYQQFKLDEE